MITKTVGELIKLSATPSGTYEFTPYVFTSRDHYVDLQIFGDDLYICARDKETLAEYWSLPNGSFEAGQNPLFIHLTKPAVQAVLSKHVTLSGSDEEYLESKA